MIAEAPETEQPCDSGLEVRLAQTPDEIEAAQRLRYQVFYEEMGAKPSPDMQGFLDQIQARALEGVKVAGFDTRMTNKLITIFGTAAPKIAKALKEKGGTLVGEPLGIYVKGGEGPLKDGEVERAAAWAKGLLGS